MLTPLELAVVRIYSKEGGFVVGAGFLVSQQYILTCAHVIAGALDVDRCSAKAPKDEIVLDFPRVAHTKRLRARVVFWRPVDLLEEEEEEDIAGLELIDLVPDEAKPQGLVLGHNSSEHEFEAFGFPKGEHNGVWASGILRRRTANGRIQIEDTKQSGYRLEQGFSGTPVWDRKIQGIVGIAVSADQERPEAKVAFIIPTDILTKAWDKLIPQDFHPYRGLEAFQAEDAQFFFGRDRFRLEILKDLETQQLITVIGPSGSGKSSLVFAGLLPSLMKQGNWLTGNFRPTRYPLFGLASACISLLQTGIGDAERFLYASQLKVEIEEARLHFGQLVGSILEKNPGKKILLVVDQFEELYTECEDEKQQQLFIDQLLEVIHSNPNFTLVLTLRADFLEYALSYRPFADAIPAADAMLGPMNLEELREAIQKPIENLATIEPGLTERILEDVEQEPGKLPLLEFALTQLWEKRTNGLLTHKAYSEIGGVGKALAKYAEAKFQELSEVDQQRAKRVFIQLVRPGDETQDSRKTQDTRRLATRSEVGHDNWDLIVWLATKRLVVTGIDKFTREETVEVVHEALIREWERLQKWINTGRSFRLWQERLQAAYNQWQRVNQSKDALLQGIDVGDAEGWLQRRADEISPEQRSFIKRSINLRDWKRRRTVYISTGMSTIVSVLGILTGLFAIGQTNEKINAQIALAESKFALGQKLDALVEAIGASGELQRFPGKYVAQIATRQVVIDTLPKLVYGVRESNRFSDHSDKVENAIFSPDGKIIATTSADESVKLWCSNGKLLDTLDEHRNWVNSASFSVNGEFLLTASSDKTVKLWKINLQDGQDDKCPTVNPDLVESFRGHQGWVTDVEFLQGAQKFITSSRDGTVKIWDIENGLIQDIIIEPDRESATNEIWGIAVHPKDEVFAAASQDGTVKLMGFDGTFVDVLQAHSQRVRDVNFSPDGKLIVSGSDDNTGIVWSYNEGKLLYRLEGHEGHVNQVRFSPDNQAIATVSDGDSNNLKLWNLNGALLATLEGHTARVKGVDFSPDGATIATASWDTTVRLWDVRGITPLNLQGHVNRTMDVNFSPDDIILASASWDRRMILWNVDSGDRVREFQHTDRLNSAIFSPDNELIATTTSSRDRTISLWDRNGLSVARIHNAHDDYIRDLSFSPDGQLFVTASGDRTVKVWTRDGELLRTIQAHLQGVYGVAFSPDGKIIASSSQDRTVKLWNLQGELLKTLEGHNDWVWNVSFSPDGQVIASASEDGTVKLWNQDGTPIKTLEDHTARVSDVAFSPDGQLIATGSADATIKLWNSDGQLLTTIEGHLDRVMSVSFSSDSRLLASSSVDGEVKIWDLSSQDFVSDLDTLLVQGCHWVEDFLTHHPELAGANPSVQRTCWQSGKVK